MGIRAESLPLFLKDIKISHSLFALPFAASVLSLGIVPLPLPRDLLLLTVAMVLARSFAMGMNRFLDRQIDGENPRTAGRLVPAGILRPQESLFWSLAAGLGFVAVGLLLNPLAGVLSLPLLAVLGFYPRMKGISWATHWYLGACLGLAPVAVGVAVVGEILWPAVLIGLAVAVWTAGFDILYALQDLQFDRQRSLHSFPARFGVKASLAMSSCCFALMIASLAGLGFILVLPPLYYLGILLLAAILGYEIHLVSDSTETHVSKNLNAAFFNANASVSVLYFILTLLVVDWGALS